MQSGKIGHEKQHLLSKSGSKSVPGPELLILAASLSVFRIPATVFPLPGPPGAGLALKRWGTAADHHVLDQALLKISKVTNNVPAETGKNVGPYSLAKT